MSCDEEDFTSDRTYYRRKKKRRLGTTNSSEASIYRTSAQRFVVVSCRLLSQLVHARAGYQCRSSKKEAAWKITHQEKKRYLI